MDSDTAAARAALRKKFGGSAGARAGGVRRKRKVATKATSTDDKKLQSTLKRLSVNPIPAIEEVNMFKNDGKIVHFKNPKVQASIGANTYVVSGAAQEKTMMELMPGILNQIGPEELSDLKNLVGAMSKQAGAEGDDDEDIPDLDGDFEAAADE
jgi:nascent polypeptide-associated complex subunit beta